MPNDMGRNLLAIALCALGFSMALCINMLSDSFELRGFSAWLLFLTGFAAAWKIKNLARAVHGKPVIS